MNYGPTLPISEEIHATKYRLPGETFVAAMARLARTLGDNLAHRTALFDIFANQRFMAAGRVQAAIGSGRDITPYNCFVSGQIQDDYGDIMDKVKEAGMTMRLGGGIGYDFSRLRPRGDLISKLGSHASGPVSFMQIFDATCKTVASAGHRRGAQMGVLRVDHPDIQEFIRAKNNSTNLTAFNISVGVTDEFMEAVVAGSPFDLKFGGKVYKTIDARELWDEIMQSTWDWAEPGVLFLDRANEMNNLWYCETFEATNPCAEQWLPPYGACLLGSFNLVKYVVQADMLDPTDRHFDMAQFSRDIQEVVRAMDNVVDVAVYPLPQQEKEAKDKRRMGLGVTGLANALEALDMPYGSPEFLEMEELILETLANVAYLTSAHLAREKGTFPLYSTDGILGSHFIKNLNPYVQNEIAKHGLRNSHLTSIAPTGTISLSADNVSSGIEPVFSYGYDRTIQTPNGPRVERVDDYGVRVFGVHGRRANDISVDDHLNVLLVAQKWVDSSVSKTCNVGDHVTFDQFKDIYMKAWKGGAKGCTTFRAAGKRFGVLVSADDAPATSEDIGTPVDTEEATEPVACFYDPETGRKTCE